jgi:predicted kinase
MECVILMGIQASGKSTFFVQQFVNTHVRINLDMLKTRTRETKLIDACIDGKTKFIVDNTNVTKEDRQRYIQKVKDAGYKVIGYFMDAPVKDCVVRNTIRGDKVPSAAIRATYNRLQTPTLDEGFDQLFFVKHGPDGFEAEEITK